jgi:hypothetical protein
MTRRPSTPRSPSCTLSSKMRTVSVVRRYPIAAMLLGAWLGVACSGSTSAPSAAPDAAASSASDSGADSTSATLTDAAADREEAGALPTALSGAVQKGPFVRGSSVTVQELDPTLTPTGRTFQVTTNDDEGDFSIPVNVSSRYVEVVASGFYFDELTNALSSAPLTLRALADLQGGAIVNVTLLTSMSEPLERNLVAGGASFAQATAQAESAVLTAFGFGASSLGSSFIGVGLTGSGSASAEALAASLIVQQYARSLGNSEVAQLSQLLGQVGAATADAGGDAMLAALHDTLCATIWLIDPASVRSNLTAYYASLGASVTVPPFEQFLCGCGLLCTPDGGTAATCIDPKTDPNNCGACGTSCPTTAACQGGACVCPGTQIICGGVCVDPNSDVNNCNGCGQRCAAPFTSCAGGQCDCPIASGTGECACGCSSPCSECEAPLVGAGGSCYATPTIIPGTPGYFYPTCITSLSCLNGGCQLAMPDSGSPQDAAGISEGDAGPGLGQPCNTSGPGPACAPSLTCSGGTCVDGAGLGGIDAGADAGPGLGQPCNILSGPAMCAPSLTCVLGKCVVEVQPGGAYCDNNDYVCNSNYPGCGGPYQPACHTDTHTCECTCNCESSCNQCAASLLGAGATCYATPTIDPNGTGDFYLTCNNSTSCINGICQ